MEVVAVALLVAYVLIVMVGLPIVGFRHARLDNPRGRDRRFVQRSEHPMPDKSYLGHGDTG